MVSIILPVYNARTDLKRCVQSVLSQTYGDFELILINDGSTDGSAALCDELAAGDSRITVIHQENAGVSVARNTGLDAARGEWVCFVDADDTLEPDMLERTLDAARQHDVQLVLFDPYVRAKGQSRAEVDSMPFFPESTVVTKKEMTPTQLRFMAGTVWRILYKRALIESNGLRFDEILPLSEDRLFNIGALGCCDRLYYLRQPLYHYWVNPGSAARKYRENMMDVVINTHKRLSAALETYWGPEYLPIYERVNLVDGALLCVYNAFSPKSSMTLGQKYGQVKQIVNRPEIRCAYEKLEKKSVRQQLVWHRCCALLCVTAWLWHLKHR